MLHLKKIAVTGGIASGKTTVCQILRNYGAYVVSADEIVHQLLSSNTLLTGKVVDLLGTEVLSNSQLDRKKIAEVVFAHPEKLRALEKILHPAVFDEITKTYERVCAEGLSLFFVVEMPLLYETESAPFYDVVIAVIADDLLCRNRFQKHTGLSMKHYDLRYKQQIPPDQKAARAHFTLFNNGTIQELEAAVQKLLPTLYH